MTAVQTERSELNPCIDSFVFVKRIITSVHPKLTFFVVFVAVENYKFRSVNKTQRLHSYPGDYEHILYLYLSLL